MRSPGGKHVRHEEQARSVPAPPTGPSDANWLTLEQTSRRLGVHAATLRRWADQRAISVFLTPGGHRRFRRSDVERFEQEHRRENMPANPGEQWADRAIAHTRQSIAQQRWLADYDEGERNADRHVGRRLIGLMLQFAARTDECTDLLAEARAIGEQYARIGLRHGQLVADLLRAVSFFRGILLESVFPQPPDAAMASAQASLHLLRRIETLLDEVQIGVVEPYVAGTRT